MKPAVLLVGICSALLCLLYLLWHGTQGAKGDGLASFQLDAISQEKSSGETTGVGELEGASHLVEKNRSSFGGLEPQEEQQLLLGSVLLLDPRTLKVPVGTQIRFTKESGEVVELALDPSGAVELPIGVWSVEVPGSGWQATPSRVSLEETPRQTVWVSRARSATVRVLSNGGTPIANARVEWWPTTGKAFNFLLRRVPKILSPESTVTTDPSGRAFLENLGLGIGSLKVAAEGFESRQQVLLAAIEGELPVVLAPVTKEGRELQFVDNSGAEAILGIEVRTGSGDWVAAGDDRGRVTLPGWVEPQAYLALHAPGYMPAGLLLSKLELDRTQIEWARATQVKFFSKDKVPFLANDEISDSPGGPLVYRSNCGAKMAPSNEVRRVFPANTEVLVQAVDVKGRAAEVFVDTRLAPPLIELDFQPSRSLRVVATAPDGRVLRNIFAMSARSGPAYRIDPGNDGRLVIPLEHKPSYIQLLAEGYGVISLDPIHSSLADLEGELQVEMRPVADLVMQVVDEAEIPIMGIELSFSGKLYEEAFHKYPDLDGGTPSQHPGWSISEGPLRRITTDVEGRIRLTGQALGFYDVSASVSGSVDPSYARTYAPSYETIEHRGSEPLRLQIPRPVLAQVEVFSIHDGSPLGSVRLQSLKHPERRIRDQIGSRWQGWINPNLGELMISSPGYGTETVQSQDLARSRSIKIGLRSDQASSLFFTGDWDSLPHSKFSVRALKDVYRKQPGRRMLAVWEAEATIEEGEAPVIFPFPGGFQLPPVEQGQFIWTFEPSPFQWSMGTQPRIHVTRTESSVQRSKD